MALTDAKIRAAKHTDKAYKLTDGAGMFLLVHPKALLQIVGGDKLIIP
ncbi:DUF4102 domain-containing protein, partial [Escherichia coli]|nr:DUF4102 domain-containing protein [Escherichia coli]